MAKSPTDKTSKSRTSQKAAGNPVPSKSGSKSGTTPKERAQPRAATRSRAETRSQPVSTQSQPAAKSQSTSDTPAKTPARSGATVPQNWLASIETMISSQDGREILADALRAAANVLSRPRQDRQQGAETRDQQDAGTGRQQGFSAASRQAERAGAAGFGPGADVAMDTQLPLTAAGEQADPMTGTQPGSADSEGGTAAGVPASVGLQEEAMQQVLNRAACDSQSGGRRIIRLRPAKSVSLRGLREHFAHHR